MHSLLCIKNGLVFFRDEFRELEILIDEERIVKIGHNLKADSYYDAKGCIVFPGLIDPHVHLREPGAEYKEDFKSGTMAAIAGGFTTVIDMPNNPLPTITIARYKEKKELAKKKALCDVFFHFGATDNNQGEAKKAGALSMKFYLGKTTGDLLLKEKDSIEKHFQTFDGVFVFHASSSEGDEVTQIEKTIENISSVGFLAKKYKRNCHIAHVSASEELEKARFFNITTETAPHYLFLSSKDAARLGNKGTVYPNLRSDSVRKKLLQNISLIDCIATDHAPHTLEDKENGAHGFPGLETSLALMLKLYHERILSLEEIIKKMSAVPSRLFRLSDRGEIREGAKADITIVDLKKEWKVEGEELYTKCKWSPFEGQILKGKVKSVLFNGNLVFDYFSFF